MQNFIESIKDIKLQPGECITSYDFIALITSVPVAKALNIIHYKIVQDQLTSSFFSLVWWTDEKTRELEA